MSPSTVRRYDADTIFDALRGLVTVADNSDDFIEPIIPSEEWDHLKADWSPLSSE
jgi:hypothetical protein